MEQLADQKNQNSTNDVPFPSNSNENLIAEEPLYHEDSVITDEEPRQSKSMEVATGRIDDPPKFAGLMEINTLDDGSVKQHGQSDMTQEISLRNIDSEHQIESSMTIETFFVEEIREEIVRVMLASPKNSGKAGFTQASISSDEAVPHDSVSPSSSFISDNIQKEMSKITDKEIDKNTSCSFQNSSDSNISNIVNHQLEFSPSVSAFFEEDDKVPENSEQKTSAIDPEDFFLQCAADEDDSRTELQLADDTQDTDSSGQSSTSITSTVSAVCLSDWRPPTNCDRKLNLKQDLSFELHSDKTNSIVSKSQPCCSEIKAILPSSLNEEVSEFSKHVDVTPTKENLELLKITNENQNSKTEIDSSVPLSKCQDHSDQNISLPMVTSNDLTSIGFETNQNQNFSSTLMLSSGNSSEHVEASENNETYFDESLESPSYIVSSVLKAVFGTSFENDIFGDVKTTTATAPSTSISEDKTSDEKCSLENIFLPIKERKINEQFDFLENDGSCNMIPLVNTTNETEDSSSGKKSQSELKKDSNQIESKQEEFKILADFETESKENKYSVSDNQSEFHEIKFLTAQDKNGVSQPKQISSHDHRTNKADTLPNSESVQHEEKTCHDLERVNEKLEPTKTVNESIDSDNKIEQASISSLSASDSSSMKQDQKKPDQLIEDNSETENKNTIDPTSLQYAVLEEQLKKYYEDQLEQLRFAVKQKENTIVLLQRENSILEKEKAAFRCERDSAIKAKENVVITFATQEKSVIDFKKEKEKLEKQLLEARRDVKAISAKCNAVSEEKSRLTYVLDEKCNEAKRLQSEIYKHKSDYNHLESKLRSNLSKLNQESAQKLALEKKLEEERNSQSRLDEKAYENLKVEFEANCIMQKHQNEQKDQIIDGLTSELKRVENQLKTTLEQLNTEKDLKTKLTLDLESVQKQLHFAQNIQSIEMLNAAKLRSQLDEMLVLKTQNTINEERIAELLEKTTELEGRLTDSVEDLQALHVKEAELLTVSKEMSEAIVRFQNEICLLKSKVQAMHTENDLLKKEKSELSAKSKILESQIKAEIQQRLDERVLFTKHLSERTKLYETVKARYENSLGELEANKKKHTKVLKENKRELEKLRKLKELEIHGSKISSTSSRSPNRKQTDNGRASETSSESQPNFNSHESPTKQHLIERILRLQKSSARQAEKIDFLENHSLSLVSELQKKSRVIQHYMVREQAGALTTTKSDENKKQLAKYGSGVMSAIYSGITGTNQSMTLELSLEINKKLQAVLEDTLLKNITLKENLDVLGLEVDKLTRKMCQTNNERM